MSESCRQLKYLNEGENMVYGYIRVSTDKQTVENQRYEINAFAVKEKIEISAWFEETISGCKDYETRKLGKLLSKMKPGDIMICTELSRLGRSLFMIMSILNLCMKQNVRVWTIKDNYRLGSDISSKVLAFAFGLLAEIERNLISQRTKEALARKKAEGIKLGRPLGSKNKEHKLTGKEKMIDQFFAKGKSMSYIAKKLNVHRMTLKRFLKKDSE